MLLHLASASGLFALLLGYSRDPQRVLILLLFPDSAKCDAYPYIASSLSKENCCNICHTKRIQNYSKHFLEKDKMAQFVLFVCV